MKPEGDPGMKHQFLKLAIGLSLSVAVALPAAGDAVHDAIECEQFLVIRYT